MKSEKLLEIIGEAKETYVLSALDSRNRKKTSPKRIALGRAVLIAAIIAMMLLLVGCTVAYILSLHEKKVGESTGTIYFDEDGQRIPPTEISQDVISLFGYRGSPYYQASAEWYEFKKTYDPDRSLFPHDATALEFDAFYFDTYDCYTPEMVSELNEVATKYGLELLGISSTFQSWDTDLFFEATELTSLCVPNVAAEITYRGGHLFSNGSFDFDMVILPHDRNSLWSNKVNATVYYTEKDFFRPLSSTILSDTYEEWIYTASDGNEILIAANNSNVLLFTEQDNAYITITITTNNNPIVTSHDPKPSHKAVEQLAEIFDYSICPQITDMDAIQLKLDASWEAWKLQEDERNKPIRYMGDFAGYLKSTYTRLSPSVYYTFHDINGDGVDDLLLGNKDGTFSSAKALYNGSVVDLHLSGTFLLCENNIIEGYHSIGTYSSYGYYILDGYDSQGKGEHVKLLEFLSYDSNENIYKYSNDGTDVFTVEVTEDTAMSILEKYVYVDLDMKPLMEFPVQNDGTTLGEYIQANEIILTDETQMAIYAEEVQKAIDSEHIEYNYYCLWDINGDGITDLLLAETDSHFSDAITVYNGEPYSLWHWTHINLCENGVIRITNVNTRADRYHFFIYEHGEQKLVEYIEYNAIEDKWYQSSDGNYEFDQVLTTEQANKILDSYLPIHPDLIPLSDFPS